MDVFSRVWKAGFFFASGMMGAAAMAAAIALAFGYFFKAMDETDSKDKRSQMALRIDHGTGCHYLESNSGMLSPRMGNDGKQLCKEKK